jgi:serine/threonine-protein kinase
MPDAPSPEFLALQEAVVGRYSLERELGRGGMGIVFLAHEVALDRPVALKLLPPELAVRPQLRQRFLREARTAAKLSHPHIVPIHAVDQAGDFVFFAMAFIDGQSLGQRVRLRGPLPASEATRILREVAWALAYAHAQGVVHRDVKPDNILLERGSGRALVTDFGIAHVREAPGMTAVGEVLGTAEYMSPEQASGESVDARSDIYSLGVLGYYALSGRLPFEGETVGAVLAKHITQPAPPVTAVAPGAPSRLARTVDQCLAKEPARRYADGAELAEALGSALEERRELPVPLRVFVQKNRDLFRTSGFGVIFVLMFAPAFLAGTLEGSPVAAVLLVATLGAITVGPAGLLAGHARRLLRAGYGVEDARMALKADFDRRQEELAFEYGRKVPIIERVARDIALAALPGFGISLAALGINSEWYWAYGVMVLAGFVGVGAGLVAANAYERRKNVGAKRRLKLWAGRVGRWLFRIAGLGLRPAALGTGATYRRTELAIGMAAHRLFEELPKATRKELRDLPDVVRRLEDDAQRMRVRLEQLNSLIDAVGDERYASRAPAATTDAAPSDRRRALNRDLVAARDAAQRRLGDAVASLETIRLGLLRMQAGTGDVASITADLASAREVAQAVELLLEGQEEVERLLAPDDGSPTTL